MKINKREKNYTVYIKEAEKIFNITIQPEKEIITFSSWGSITEVQILKKVLANFEKENPEIKVNFIHIPQSYFQKIHLLFASTLLLPNVIPKK